MPRWYLKLFTQGNLIKHALRGDRLRCRAPVGVLTSELKFALADQKAALMQILEAEGHDAPPPEVAEDAEIIAVKVWSEILGEAIWVVADDLPREKWPAEAWVYTHAEVKILQQVGPATLMWVQTVKEDFDARVVASRVRPARRITDADPE
jgi:TubC N-terminal docking domain